MSPINRVCVAERSEVEVKAAAAAAVTIKEIKLEKNVRLLQLAELQIFMWQK